MTNTQTPGLSIVIPAYNEEKGIGGVMQQLTAMMQSADFDYEIIVVNDGSKDNTGAMLADLADIHLIEHQVNRGYGAALKTGIRAAKHTHICITDADGTYPNERIPAFYAKLQAEGCDMLVGARTGENVAIPLVRQPAKWAIRHLAIVVAGQHIPDINSGLRLFDRDVCLRFFGLLPNTFSFTTTITLGLLTNGYHVVYEPIDYLPRKGRSKIKPIRDTLNFVQLIIRMGLYFAPLKVFLPLSGMLLLFSLVWAVGSLALFGRVADVTTLVIFTTGIQVAVIGMLAELINVRVPNPYR